MFASSLVLWYILIGKTVLITHAESGETHSFVLLPDKIREYECHFRESIYKKASFLRLIFVSLLQINAMPDGLIVIMESAIRKEKSYIIAYNGNCSPAFNRFFTHIRLKKTSSLELLELLGGII